MMVCSRLRFRVSMTRSSILKNIIRQSLMSSDKRTHSLGKRWQLLWHRKMRQTRAWMNQFSDKRFSKLRMCQLGANGRHLMTKATLNTEQPITDHRRSTILLREQSLKTVSRETTRIFMAIGRTQTYKTTGRAAMDLSLQRTAARNLRKLQRFSQEPRRPWTNTDETSLRKTDLLIKRIRKS